MKEILEKSNYLKMVKIGEVVEGKVIGKGRAAVYIDLGTLGVGAIYGKEFYAAKDQIKKLKDGDPVISKIVGLENEQGQIELSAVEADKELIWEELKQKKENNEKIKVKILGANKGGLLAKIGNIPAFLPVSQLSAQNYPRVEGGDTSKILQELQKFIGKEMEVRVFDLSQKEEKIILSEKIKEMEKIQESLSNYKTGDTVEGDITGVVDFGAFIRFGEGIEGLIHISELDWQLIEDPLEIIKVGDKVKVKIIDISNNKVFLSLKAMKKDPWQNIEEKYKEGSIIKGKVVKLNSFGAFIQIDSLNKKEKIQGLCHISELGTKAKMENNLKIGEEYKFQIISISSKEHKMSLKPVK